MLFFFSWHRCRLRLHGHPYAVQPLHGHAASVAGELAPALVRADHRGAAEPLRQSQEHQDPTNQSDRLVQAQHAARLVCTREWRDQSTACTNTHTRISFLLSVFCDERVVPGSKELYWSIHELPESPSDSRDTASSRSTPTNRIATSSANTPSPPLTPRTAMQSEQS